MKRSIARLCAAAVLVCPWAMYAQRGGNDWMTAGFDVQRSSWLRADAKIAPENFKTPAFALVWKLPMEAKPGAGAAITPPVLLDFYIGYRGFRTLGFFATSSGRVVAVDTDLGRLEWEKQLATVPASGSGCLGGMTSSLTRPTSAGYPPTMGGRGFGRGGAAKSAVSEPYQGAVTIRPNAPPQPPRPAPPKPTAADASNPFAPRVQYAVAVAPDGKLHSMWVSNGNEASAALDFLPSGADASGLVVFDNTAYAATRNCGGSEAGVWAIDLNTKKVSHWTARENKMNGVAAGPDGTVYASAGHDLAALAPRDLTVVAKYTNDGGEFTSTPVIFDYKGRNLLAVTTAHGRLKMYDAARLDAGEVAGTDAYAAHEYAAGALASWLDAAGTRWILSPTESSIAAFKIEEKDGKPELVRAWTSSKMAAPLPPIVVNGVVFALAGGAQGGPNAVLYALDALSGDKLWDSGAAIASHAVRGGLAAGGSRVYVAAQDGVEYVFGFPIEH